MGVTESFDSLSFRDWEDSERDADDKLKDAGLIVSSMRVWRKELFVLRATNLWLRRVWRAPRRAYDMRATPLCFRHHLSVPIAN